MINCPRKKDTEQARLISELQDALKQQEQQTIQRFEGEVAKLKQKILDEKAKL